MYCTVRYADRCDYCSALLTTCYAMQVIRAILGIPKYYRIILFKWLKSYPSEYFSRVLEVLQGFLSFALSSRSLALDATPVVMVLETLYQCNAEESIVPEARFYHDAVLMRTVNIFDEWVKYRQQGQQSAVFNYCSYPFLFHDRHKLLLIQFEFQNQQYQQVSLLGDDVVQ